jgi:hypothetical protein
MFAISVSYGFRVDKKSRTGIEDQLSSCGGFGRRRMRKAVSKKERPT